MGLALEMVLQVAEVTKPVSRSYCWWMGEAEWKNFSGPESSDHFRNYVKAEAAPSAPAWRCWSAVDCCVVAASLQMFDERQKGSYLTVVQTAREFRMSGWFYSSVVAPKWGAFKWSHLAVEGFFPLINAGQMFSSAQFLTVSALQGCSWSVIFVDLDAHNRNRQTLSSLLPRESRSHVSPSHFAFNSELCIIIFVDASHVKA